MLQRRKARAHSMAPSAKTGTSACKDTRDAGETAESCMICRAEPQRRSFRSRRSAFNFDAQESYAARHGLRKQASQAEVRKHARARAHAHTHA
eukprot:5648536-Pleurochrysis_carterae.AAC.1